MNIEVGAHRTTTPSGIITIFSLTTKKNELKTVHKRLIGQYHNHQQGMESEC